MKGSDSVMREKNRGSLSIEAIISFTIYISFMMLLLTIVKFSLTTITLSTAVSETTKQFATAAYPIGLVNGIQEDMDEDAKAYQGSVKLSEGIENSFIDTVINSLFSTGAGEQAAALQGGAGKIIPIVIEKGTSELWDTVSDKVILLKERNGALMVANVFNEYIKDSFVRINPDDLELVIIKFPQTKNEYIQTKANENYSKFNLIADENFKIDDMVICLEYKYTFALPFLPSVNTTIRKSAVERSWINGGNGTVTKHGDKGIEEKITKALFGKVKVAVGIKETGKCYHKTDCFTLWKGAIIKDLNEVIGKKDPCKVCKPDQMLGE